MDKTIKFLKDARELGLDLNKLIDMMSAEKCGVAATYSTEPQPETTTVEAAADPECECSPEDSTGRNKHYLKAIEFGMDHDKAVEMVQAMPEGAKLTSVEITLRLIGRVPSDKADRRACTNFIAQVSGLAPVLTLNGSPAK